MHFRRIFITGAEGFVGKFLRIALAKALPSTAFAFTTRAKQRSDEPGWVRLDLRNSQAVNAVIKEFSPDLVIHLAAQSSVHQSHNAASETWSSNVCGSVNLATALAQNGPDATILNVSSSEVYGSSFLRGLAREDTPLEPASIYGRTKQIAEEAFNDILPKSSQVITIRPFNHTGLGQDERFALPSFANQIARIEKGLQIPPLTVGNLDAERDLLDVRDVVEAYLAIIQHARQLPNRAVFNVASGMTHRIGDLLAILTSQATRSIPISTQAERLRQSDIPRAGGDPSALRQVTGWEPRYSVRETLSDLLQHARNTAR